MPNVTVPLPAARDEVAPSSDAPDELGGVNPYVSIGVFLEILDDKQPQRKLTTYAECFAMSDYYHIDEIAEMTKEDLMALREIGMTSGNATFLLRQGKRKTEAYID